MVALSEDDKLLEDIIKRATSFSSSLGPALTKVLPPLLAKLPDRDGAERPILYACENEHEPVNDLEKEVSGRCACRTHSD